jgi:hypothetical protein
VCGTIDAHGAPGHYDDALKRRMACKIISEVERLFVCTTSAHDRDRPIETGQLAHHAKQARRIGQITELRRIVRAKSAHGASTRG